jgi:hypothetical protein
MPRFLDSEIEEFDDEAFDAIARKIGRSVDQMPVQ